MKEMWITKNQLMFHYFSPTETHTEYTFVSMYKFLIRSLSL